MHRDLPRLGKTELFARLREGHGARVTVLTPNRRLAQSLQRDFDRLQQSRGLVTWETADVLPFGAWVQRFWDDALFSEAGAATPVLLTGAQEQALWEEAIAGTRYAATLFSSAPAAAQCREAWQLAHGWRVPLDAVAYPNEDARAFLDWSARYERATREGMQTDAARLPDVVIPLLPLAALRKPAVVVLFGFDIVTAQTRDFLDALAAQGCDVLEAAAAPQAACVTRVELVEAKDEVEAAARWARSRLEQGARRIGVVVPDLGARRSQLQRTFATVMQPDYLVASQGAVLPFDISLGKPLAQFPIVADALLVLALAGPAAAFEDASRVIRSAFIAGGEAELGVRARLDARLRRRATPSLGLDALVRMCKSDKVPRAPVLVDRLERLASFRKSDLFVPKAAAEWARSFSDALRLAGFPGERALDSAEHQALDKWHELLAEFATLERVTGKMGFVAALQRLRAMARDTVFQPEAHDVPIQVMGILESAGQEFDHLWIMGLTDKAWPLSARPAPFLPVRLQREAGIPQSDPVTSLELDRRITRGWMESAAEVVVSHARMEKESELAPSPLITAIALAPIEDLAIPAVATLREAMRGSAAIEVLQDGTAPALDTASRTGGTRLFRDQAACPFRAMAHHRLRSEPLETPRPGLDRRDRGTLVHEMMRAVWKSIQTRDRLVAMDDATLQPLLVACADEAIACVRRRALDGRFGQLERVRLVKLAREWLDLERRRGDFEVAATEEKRVMSFGGITVNVRLDRLDRIDNGHAVIDYKTGACKTADWMGDRPEEPQVPMYASSLSEGVAAVAFAVVKSGDSKFRGISRVPEPIPNVCTIDKDRAGKKLYRNWDHLVGGWRVALDAIGRGFAEGDARVDPKRGPATCENCDQHMFCRIAEKAPFGAIGQAEGEADE
jgi:ATP-dependent helicase/nuclease subunit B